MGYTSTQIIWKIEESREMKSKKFHRREYLKTLAKRNPWIKIRDYQIVRKHFNFDKQEKSDFSLRYIGPVHL